MLHPTQPRRRWQPESEADLKRVRECLEEVLSTPRFSASKRYPALLKYVVEKTLIGDAEHLKERTIGIEVFSRQANYDTNSDTVVRYTAGEVRKRLSLYYHEVGADSAIQIEIPSGSYVPEFYVTEPPSEAEVSVPDDSAPLAASAASPRRGARLGKVVAYTALCLVLAAAAILWHRARHKQGSIFEAFWAPIFSTTPGNPLLLCPGAVVFSPADQTGVAVARNGEQEPLISAETASSIGQLTDLFGTRQVPFQIRLPSGLTSKDLADHTVVLIGAYSNPIAMHAVSDLRYRFSAQPTQSIYDATQPAIQWARPRSWLNEPGNDYGLIARIRDPHTGRWAIVLAGLGHSGTVAAVTFVTSPSLMKMLSARLPSKWAGENLEIVIRTEVGDTKPVEPTVEAVWAGK